jgi:hypothetical protein
MTAATRLRTWAEEPPYPQAAFDVLEVLGELEPVREHE